MQIGEIDQHEWQEWIATRPESVRALAKKYPPDTLYRLDPTGQLVTITAYNEDGSVRVYIDPKFNPRRALSSGFEVFGVDPEAMTPATGKQVLEAQKGIEAHG
jgi:hypothetical protein